MRESYAEESAQIRRSFEETGDGRAALIQRTKLVDAIALRLWREIVSAEPDGPAEDRSV